MDIDMQTFKTPQAWAVIIPAVLLVWALSATARMYDNRSDALYQIEQTRQAGEAAEAIVELKKNTDPANALRMGSFDSVASARQCAKHAGIDETKINRGTTSPPKTRNGVSIYRETFNINNVRLLQIAKFIDHAKENYTSLNCTQLTINNSRNKSKDSWDATINFEYSKKNGASSN